MSEELKDAWRLVATWATQVMEEQDKVTVRRAKQDHIVWPTKEMKEFFARTCRRTRAQEDRERLARPDKEGDKADQQMLRLHLMLKYPAEPTGYIRERR